VADATGSGEGGVSSVVTGMSPGSSKRWGGGEATVGISGESPAALMDHPMMGPTEQGQIGQVGPGRVQSAGGDQQDRFGPGHL
jgi:hypothetical protein